LGEKSFSQYIHIHVYIYVAVANEEMKSIFYTITYILCETRGR